MLGSSDVPLSFGNLNLNESVFNNSSLDQKPTIDKNKEAKIGGNLNFKGFEFNLIQPMEFPKPRVYISAKIPKPRVNTETNPFNKYTDFRLQVKATLEEEWKSLEETIDTLCFDPILPGEFDHRAQPLLDKVNQIFEINMKPVRLQLDEQKKILAEAREKFQKVESEMKKMEKERDFWRNKIECHKTVTERNLKAFEQNPKIWKKDDIIRWLCAIEGGKFRTRQAIMNEKATLLGIKGGDDLENLLDSSELAGLGFKDASERKIVLKNLKRILKIPLPEEEACVICMIGKRSHVLIPCGHLCLCETCADRVKFDKCPICRTHISQVVKTFSV